MLSLNRCAWCTPDPDYIRYHDEEWGVPVHDDRTLFEMLILEGVKSTSPSRLHSNYPTYEICTALNVWNWCEQTLTSVACNF